jgi:hypothetical protein
VQVTHGVVEALVDVVCHDTGVAPKRVALFSLGTLVVYRSIRTVTQVPLMCLVQSLLQLLSAAVVHLAVALFVELHGH